MQQHETVIVLILIAGLVATIPAQAQVIHRVHVGGPDYCNAIGQRPGCDANFTLTALEFLDGRVIGQYSDIFSGGTDGIHAVIDCLSVNGNEAWVSGWITHGTIGNSDLSGLPVATRVRDLGNSPNDPPDQISFSWIGDSRPCWYQTNYPVFDVPQGQVVVE
jgi:hypothetical protein